MSKKPKRRVGEPHVRLYWYELECQAYCSLSGNARALLIEFRALYRGGENRVFLSARQMQERLGVGQRPAQRARDELLDRGFIRVIERGAFHRKTKQATVYALTNEPLTNADGDVAPKDYMRWQPPKRKNTVAVLTTVGSQNDYRGHPAPAIKPRNGSRNDYRKSENPKFTVAETATQIVLPRDLGGTEGAVGGGVDPARVPTSTAEP